MIKKIVAFGDSCTYGHGLIDCFKKNGDPGDKPSKLAWPQLLAKQFEAKSYNLGIPGASNKEIANRILKTKLDKDATVIVCWSYVDRHCIIKKNSIEQIGHWKIDKISKAYYKNIYDRHDHMWQFYSTINHIDLFLKAQGIDCNHFHVDKNELSEPRWNTVKMIPVDYADIRHQHALAEDKMHPGPAAHKQVAEELYNFFTRTRSSVG